MRTSLIVKSALLNFIVAASALCAKEDQNAVENIIRWAHSSITQIEGEKIFLKPERLYLERGTVCVEPIDGTEFAIPVLFSSDGRPYMQVGESILFNSWKCDCGTWNHKWDNPKYCRRCDKSR